MAEPEVPSSEVPLADIGAFVPFPTALFDEQMPHLKDTEWRLLCVIVRQTMGWKSGKGRKRRDWMTQKQLIARTGRNSAALSNALDALVRKSLVVCEDKQGKPLLTPQQRRWHRSRIYFSLSPLLLQPKLISLQKTENPKSKVSMHARRTEDFKAGEHGRGRIYSGWSQAGAIAQERYADTENVSPS